MVEKYVILANSNDKTIDIPRQLIEINGEPLIKRTIRLLKENDVKDILVVAKDKRFKNLDAEIYEPKDNTYDYKTGKGYFLDMFSFDLLKEPVCFIWGDVYFSEYAIKTIVENDTNSTLFFCSYENHDKRYIKHHDEPFAYKIVDTELFKKHIKIVKDLYDKGETVRHPIVWELYRSINGIDVNTHIMTDNYLAINDISCDIDGINDLKLLKQIIEGGKMIKVEAIESFTLQEFDKIKNLQRKAIDRKGTLFVGDTFECDEEMCKYLTGGNALKKVVVKVIEVLPKEEPEATMVEVEIHLPKEEKPKKKKTSKK